MVALRLSSEGEPGQGLVKAIRALGRQPERTATTPGGNCAPYEILAAPQEKMGAGIPGLWSRSPSAPAGASAGVAGPPQRPSGARWPPRPGPRVSPGA